MANTELQFEMAMRDQVIHNQREMLRNMWDLLMGLGLDEGRILDLAAKRGITIEDWTMTPNLGHSARKQSLELAFGRITPSGYFDIGHSYSRSSCIFDQYEDSGPRSLPKKCRESPSAFCRGEDHGSNYLASHDHSPSAYMRLRKSSEHWAGGRQNSWFNTPDKHPQDLRSSCPEMRIQSSPYGESCISASAVTGNFAQQQKVWMPKELHYCLFPILCVSSTNRIDIGLELLQLQVLISYC